MPKQPVSREEYYANDPTIPYEEWLELHDWVKRDVFGTRKWVLITYYAVLIAIGIIAVCALNGCGVSGLAYRPAASVA